MANTPERLPGGKLNPTQSTTGLVVWLGEAVSKEGVMGRSSTGRPHHQHPGEKARSGELPSIPWHGLRVCALN